MTIAYHDALTRCIDHKNLSPEEMQELFTAIMTGEMPETMAAALLMALRVKGESPEELAGAAEVMRQACRHADIPNAADAVDLCGTGGDGRNTFNISTTAMFAAAAAGAPVAKHGNRSASSVSGSADALEALGAYIETGPAEVARSIQETGIGFMFAPLFHQSMKTVLPLRKALKVKTLFNILGPLTNPARAANQLIGVFHPDLIPLLGGALKALGSRRVLLLHGLDGLDEATLGAPTLVGELDNGEIRRYTIDPEMFGLQMVSSQRLVVRSAAESCEIIHRVLADEAGPARDVVVLNAGLAIYAAHLADSIQDGIGQARAQLQSGRAKAKLQQFIDFSQSLKAQAAGTCPPQTP